MSNYVRLTRAAPLQWVAFGTLIVAALSIRVCYLVVAYQFPGTPIIRPHIESTALVFALAGLTFRFCTDVRAVTKSQLSSSPHWMLWLGFVCIALVMYWPALFLGFLSDDFILVQRAATWNVGQVAPQLFRPLPMFVWAIIVHLGGGAAALHLLNILVHATNAYLAGRIVAGWVPGLRWSVFAALLVLAAPLGPEAVAWCAGTFDLFTAGLLMGVVLVVRRPDATSWNRMLFLVLSGSALLSKETAVILPLLLVLDGWVRGAMSRRVWLDVGLSTALVAIFAAVRLQSAGAIGTFSRYRVQRLVFDSFGSLAAPWHARLTAAEPLLRPAIAVLVIALLTAFFLFRGPRWRSKVALGAATWVLISVLPLITMFYVGAHLEGARYLYLAAAGWAALLVAAASELSEGRSRAGTVVMLAVGVVLGAAALGVRVHLTEWTHAAKTRDAVLRSAAADPRLHSCPVVYLQDLPESVDGAYVFANGAREAFADVGIDAFVRNQRGACSFRWEPGSGGFVPSSRMP